MKFAHLGFSIGVSIVFDALRDGDREDGVRSAADGVHQRRGRSSVEHALTEHVQRGLPAQDGHLGQPVNKYTGLVLQHLTGGKPWEKKCRKCRENLAP